MNCTCKTLSTLFLMLVLTFIATSTHAQSITITPSAEALVSSDYIDTHLKKMESLLNEKNIAAAELELTTLNKRLEAQQVTPTIINTYIKVGKLYYKYKHYNNAITQYEKAIALTKVDDDESARLLASAYHEIAQCYKHLKDIPKSITNYQKSLNIHQDRQDSFSVAIELKNIAMAENKQENYISALDHAHRSLTILSSESFPLRYAQVVLTTGIIYRNIGHYEKSLEYIQQAKTLYEQENDIIHLAEVDNQIGLIYTNLGQLDNAKSFYTQTIELPIDSVKPETRGAAFRELGVISYHQNNLTQSIDMLSTSLEIYKSINSFSKTTRIDLLLGRNYLELNTPTIATRYFEQSLALALQYDQIDFQIQSLNYLGEVIWDQDLERSIALFERALALSTLVDAKQEKMKTYHWLKESQKRKGNLDKALEYSEKKYQLSQIIQQESDELDFTRFQVILASYKLEDELKGLRDSAELSELKLTRQQNELAIMKQTQLISDLEIKEKRFVNLLLIIGLSGFLILALYILYLYKNTKIRNQELDYLASKDPLTDCFNRRILYSRFNKSIETIKKPQQYSVVLADIDSFKAINDTYGHTFGDKVIQGIAKILLDNTNEHDTVARFGGEEFCILLPNLTDIEATHLAEKMRQEIENEHFESVKTTCSFGVASFHHDVESTLTLIEQADMALYQSKDKGRNRVSVWRD